jgi:transcriptional regulator with XRE-family HTH domain
MDIFKSHFGIKLTKLLRERKIKQSWLAEELKIDPPNISRWANGLNFPDEENFKKLCKVLDIDGAYFLGDLTPKSDLIIGIIARLPTLDENELLGIGDLIDELDARRASFNASLATSDKRKSK